MSGCGIGGRYCLAMRTVIEIDGLFDGTSAMSDATIVIEDGEIAWAGKRSRAPKTPKGEKSRMVRAAGGFAVPGLINCHSHLTLEGSANFEAETRQSEAAAALKAFRNARLTLRSGMPSAPPRPRSVVSQLRSSRCPRA